MRWLFLVGHPSGDATSDTFIQAGKLEAKVFRCGTGLKTGRDIHGVRRLSTIRAQMGESGAETPATLPGHKPVITIDRT